MIIHAQTDKTNQSTSGPTKKRFKTVETSSLFCLHDNSRNPNPNIIDIYFLDLSWHPGQAKHSTLGVRPQRNVGKLSLKLLKEPKEVNFPSDMLHHASSCFNDKFSIV
jgi:hypothetical protein